MYDAAGNCLQKRTTNGSITEVHDYVGSIEYHDGAMEAVYHREGRLIRTGSTVGSDGNPLYGYRYEYTLTDHLGNARVCFTDTDTNNRPNILQQNHYYPYGLNQMGEWQTRLPQVAFANEYQYNGIELQSDFGLNVNRAFYRVLDAAAGRWWGIDPVVHHWQSPYNSRNNAPLGVADWFGAEGREPDGERKKNIRKEYKTAKESGYSGTFKQFKQEYHPVSIDLSKSIASTFHFGKKEKASINLFFHVSSLNSEDYDELNIVQTVSVTPSNSLNEFIALGDINRFSFLWEDESEYFCDIFCHDYKGLTLQAFVDNGINSPLVRRGMKYKTLEYLEAKHLHPYYSNKNELAKYFNKKQTTLFWADEPSIAYSTQTVLFQSVLVATNYKKSGSDKILAYFSWGYHLNGEPFNTVRPIHGYNLTPLGINFRSGSYISRSMLGTVQHDYPNYNFYGTPIILDH